MALSKNNKFRIFGSKSKKLTDTQYDQLPDRDTGNKEGGIASSSLNNTALNQTSLLTTALAEFIAKKNPSDTIDSTKTAEQLVTLLEKAIGESSATGDMKKSIFATIDPGNGFVDKAKNSEKLGGKPASEYVTQEQLRNTIGKIDELLDAINGEVI